MGSEIDPFDSQETKPYKTNPQIKAVTDLVGAYQRKEVHEAEKILRENQSTFMDDPFIKSYIGDLLRALRTQYLIALIKPYTRLDLSFLARVGGHFIGDILGSHPSSN
jgi:COP9 signalosome complex subunit 2